MAGLSTFSKNKMLDALAPTTASLHSADPGDSGANEISGGSPAYARKAITFGAASAGSKAATTQPVFDVPAVTVAYAGFWDASGNWIGGQAVTSETFGAQGTYTLTGATLSEA